MADKPTTDIKAAERAADAVDAPTPQAPAQQAAAAAEPPETTKQRPIVLATWPMEEFTLPGEGDGGADLVITSTGVALSKTKAKQVETAAAASGVRLFDITPSDDAEKG